MEFQLGMIAGALIVLGLFWLGGWFDKHERKGAYVVPVEISGGPCPSHGITNAESTKRDGNG